MRTVESLSPTPALELRVETRTFLYPALRQLVRLLPLDHKRILQEVQSEVRQNPFLMDTQSRGDTVLTVISDVLPDWYEPTVATETLQAYLEGQISTFPPSQQQKLLSLLRWITPSGYLEESSIVWAAGTPWHPHELEAMIPLLQSLDPPGVGARSLQECLLLQLDPSEYLAIFIVRECLDELAACISSQVKQQQFLETLIQRQQVPKETTLAQLQAAIRQIQALEPRPGSNFNSEPIATVTPDLKVQFINERWQASLAYDVEQRFTLNLEAIELLKSAKQPREIQRLESLLQKAKNLLNALSQWQENLLKVGQFLCDQQQAFLASRDPLDLIPTAQQLVAQSVSLSDATVSRIVRDRYLLIDAPPHQTIPLSYLCARATVGGRTPQQLQQSIIELLQSESSTHPYSDTQLAQLLKLRFGVSIARRTIAKYRRLLGIENASHRKKAAK
ncbi:MAG: RNA polymerase subunit sigma-54 [Calothrix sp. C42_A2020_038]|nr:RNA polymerase subunit sigma-54 [Calothrix sp. C42_A2020_038]